MKTSTTCLLCALLLGVSFIAGMGLHGQWSHIQDPIALSPEQPPTQAASHEVMDEAQLARYLNISNEELQNVILKDDILKRNVGVYDTYRFIPYGIIGSKKVFLKIHIDKWLEYTTLSPVK
ncbi:hypothetical protein MH117_11835 [Paenibacillus sp. ACRRX]|uniref:hypothetical protein n=1 Tax=unclassified Paenibacillus TaxID=185978 RepID=UPI001EF523E4|nr:MULTISPECIES: hypothetical protein [unclassified Paenibacillus]MCG7408112.1 hypothetical protein [Paenibacillus sp. ACRRX]MDK8181505.1 hypothetical protein [Paenibacillus sp. UMB4589-SE434]